MAHAAKLNIHTVNGQAARIIHNYGPNVFCLTPPPDTVDYLQRAKQLMPPRVWAQLDQIHQCGDITDKELWLACKKKVLVCKAGQLARQLVWVDYLVGGYAMLLILSHLLLCAGLYLLAADGSVLLWQKLGVLGYVSLLMGLAMMVSSQFFWLQRTGRLAMVALSKI